MRNKFNKRLKTSRIAKFISSLGNRFDPFDRSLTLDMFLKDIRSGMMPIGGKSDQRPDFAVEIQGNSDHKDRAIAILEGPPNISGNYNSDSLEELLTGVVDIFAGTLLEYGRSVHKIAKIKKDDRTYRLHNFLCQRFLNAFWRYIQIIPKEDRNLAYKGYPMLPGFWNAVYVIIPKKDIFTIAMPKELGGYRGYRVMRKKLLRFPNAILPFSMDEMSSSEWQTSVDFQSYVRERACLVAKATTRWGWNQRNSNLEHWSEFYSFYKILTLKWAQAYLREHIVNELNQLFRRLDIEAEIVVKGLPTAQEILKIRRQMCTGKISFLDAFKACDITI